MTSVRDVIAEVFCPHWHRHEGEPPCWAHLRRAREAVTALREHFLSEERQRVLSGLIDEYYPSEIYRAVVEEMFPEDTDA